MSSQTQEIHQPGTAEGWHGVIKPDGEFQPEAGRYHLYIGKQPRDMLSRAGLTCPN
jgi:glutathionyl-hydroquinone reductase